MFGSTPRRLSSGLLRQHKSTFSSPPPPQQPSQFWRPLIIGLSGSVVGAVLYARFLPTHSVVSAHEEKKPKDERKNEFSDLSRRQKRFHDFSSCEVHGQVVMTPYDFIESLVDNKPKLTRRAKIHVTASDVKRIVDATPPIEEGSPTFFRDMHQNGIITYSEYLFLITVLTKSDVGLRTALKMMDINGDKKITIEEFRLIEDMINEKAACDTCCFHEGEVVDIPHTTLCLHLFGKDGSRIVTYDEFFTFMDNMQMEVLELEFHEYAKGREFISELDFAKILLRSTILTKFEHEEYLDRLRSRVLTPRGISLDEFKAFNVFLNNIDDFIVAVNMTKMSPGEDLDKKFFKRAVAVVTGEEIEPYVVDVVFSLFDIDGDGKLSNKEFIGVMKDRLKRGFGKFPSIKGFKGFKHCLKKEIIKANENK